jgi:flagella basal body P-ring formation protein FlgA
MFVNQGQSFAMVYKLNLRQKTLITRCDIEAGEALPSSCIGSSWQQVKKLTLHKAQPEKFVLKHARRSLVAGTVLELADWQQLMAIQAGQKVKVHYQQGAIKVEAPGTVMKAANVGDKIVVLLDGQRQSISARLGNNGDVYID